MARKYIRRGFRNTASGSHGRFDSAAGREVRTLSPKQRLLAIYVGLLGAAAVLFLFHLVDPFNIRSSSQILRGQGTVLRKLTAQDAAGQAVYLVEVAVRSETGTEFTSIARVAETSWEATSEGERVYVDYTLEPRKDAIRIEALYPYEQVPEPANP